MNACLKLAGLFVGFFMAVWVGALLLGLLAVLILIFIAGLIHGL